MSTRIVLLLTLLLKPLAALADPQAQVNDLLTRPEPPPGVVFEVAQRQESALEWALPEIKHYVEQLRKRFPNLKFAVVTHGKEEFALLRSKSSEYSAVHSAVRSLTQDEDIPVHVCGTHASWYDKQPEDFPDYVDVAPAGPAQINDYRALGYELIVVRRRD
jgi:intracellular sulfur oxidation DsrE/DsrF family protein